MRFPASRTGSEPARSFLTAEWRDLAMLNYEVDPALLRPLVPPGTELDRWNGRALASIVGFRFLQTRVLGVGIPFHRDFEEVNLRFYVRRRAPEGWRRGVVFVKELVPRVAIAWIARVLYNENYVALPMRHVVEQAPGGDTRRVRYEWRSPRRWGGLMLRVEGAPALPADDSEERFVTEHYWGYAAQRRGPALEYQVEHPRWRVWRAVETTLEADLADLYGSDFARSLAGTARSGFVADGSAVTVRRGVRLGVEPIGAQPES